MDYEEWLWGVFRVGSLLLVDLRTLDDFWEDWVVDEVALLLTRLPKATFYPDDEPPLLAYSAALRPILGVVACVVVLACCNLCG